MGNWAWTEPLECMPPRMHAPLEAHRVLEEAHRMLAYETAARAEAAMHPNNTPPCCASPLHPGRAHLDRSDTYICAKCIILV